MKRLWIGIIVLAALLILSIAVAAMMHWIHAPIADTLDAAAQAWLRGDTESAVRLSEDAARRWEQWQVFTASFADHDPMDNMDELFAQLPIWAEETDSDEFASTCRALAALERSMARSHLPLPENLLAFIPNAS